MYAIYQGSEVLEVTSHIEYVKLLENGKKVTSTAADYDFIYSQDSDKMYDKNLVYVTEITTAEQALSVKLAELSAACNAAINAGAEVTLSADTAEHFSYTIDDQANISEMFLACMMGAQSYPYHANDESCKSYTAEEVMAIYSTLAMHKTGQLTYHNQLKQYVNTLETVEDILAVTYGQELTGTYLETYNSMMQEAQTQMAAVIGGISDANTSINTDNTSDSNSSSTTDMNTNNDDETTTADS